MDRANQAVVTGGSRGIGRAVSEALVARGWNVVLVARDALAGQRAVDEIGEGGASSRLRLVVGDLSTPAGTRALAERLTEACGRIDLLVHNAGVWPPRLDRVGGIERAFAVNHLAPFLLNHLLASTLGPGSRIVQVSAGLYVAGRVDPERTPSGEDFHPLRTYASTKLANLLLLRRFAEQLRAQGVTINAVHPGVIRTGLGDRPGPLGAALRAVKLLWKAPSAGAAPIVRLGTDPALASVTGAYFHLEEERPLEPVARDEALATRLWDQATALCARELTVPR